MSNTLVSIGIPTYNRPDDLEDLLASLLDQTHQNLEIIVSDNKSEDIRVQQIIKQYAEQDKRFVPIFQKENIGMEANFNAVFEKASSEYFMWLSDDDRIASNYIESCLGFLSSNEDYVLACGMTKYKGEDGLGEKMYSYESNKIETRILDYISTAGKNSVFYGLFRREVLRNNPIEDYLGFDWNIMTSLLCFGKFKILDETFLLRSLDGVSANRKNLRRKYAIHGFRRPFFELILAKNVSKNLAKFCRNAVSEDVNWSSTRLKVFIKICQKLIRKFLT